MNLIFEEKIRGEHLSQKIAMVKEGETLLTRASMKTVKSRYQGHLIPSLLFGGVATAPEYRRRGHVREILDTAFASAPENGWAVSLLHPFSFAYYRKYGYERVADHLIVRFPMSKISHIPYCTDFVRLGDDGSRLADVLKVYDTFSANRNLMFERYDAQRFSTGADFYDKVTYLRYHGEEPVAYVTLGVERVLKVNHMEGINLNIYEMGFVNREALTDIFGFMRVFEGETDSVLIHNCAMMPEVDLALRHYTHTSYTILPDLMARVLDTERLLRLNRYPKENGRFRIGVEDRYPAVAGVFEVEYGGGQAEVRRLAAEPGQYECDLVCNASALSQLLYGYYQITPELLRYQEGVTVQGDTADFCRAFPKARNGLFEHF